jgi:hypothetical protein
MPIVRCNHLFDCSHANMYLFSSRCVGAQNNGSEIYTIIEPDGIDH